MVPSSKALRELEWLVRRPEAGMANISAHLVQHFDELQPCLPQGSSKTALVGVPDEQLAPELEGRLRRHTEARLEHRQETARERAQHAAARLSKTAHRKRKTFLLDVPTLLGDLLADRTIKTITFELDGDVRVTTPLRTLVRVRQALGKRDDLVAFVDEHGLHFRWKDGRGRLRFTSQPVDRWSTALPVELSPPALPAPAVHHIEASCAPTLVEALNEEPSPMPALPMRPSPARSARPTRRGGSWLHDILSNLGF